MRLLRLTLITSAALIVLLVSFREIGRLEAAQRSAQAGIPLKPQGCVQPCWRGIRPGETMLQQAEARLREDQALRIVSKSIASVCWEMHSGPFATGCAYSYRTVGPNTDRVEIINLFPRENAFRLGDAIVMLGAPLAAVLPCQNVNGNVYFRDSIIVVLPTHINRFSPEAAVMYLSYVSARLPWYGPNTPMWRGFVGRVRARGC